MTRSIIAGLLFSALAFHMQPAHAYLDPGTGSMLLQGLLAGIAGAVVVMRLYWAKIKAFFSDQDSSNSPDAPTVHTGDQDSAEPK